MYFRSCDKLLYDEQFLRKLTMINLSFTESKICV